MLNSIKVNEVSTDIQDYKMLIAGRPKAGKTSLFYEVVKREVGLDKGLLLAFEKGYNFLDGIHVIDINSWEDYIDVVDELSEGNHGYKFIALDTVDVARQLCEEYVVAKQRKKDGKKYEAIADLAFGKGYELLQREWAKQIKLLESADLGLFYITHDKDRLVKEKSGAEYEKTGVSVTGRIGEEIKNNSDFIVFIDIESQKERGKVKENRFIRFRGDGTTEAGGRISDVPEVIPYDIDLFIQTIKDATSKQRSSTPIQPKKLQEVEEATEVVEVEEDKAMTLEEVKSAFATKFKTMSSEKKREVAKVFKEELGTIDYNSSDDVDALNEIYQGL